VGGAGHCSHIRSSLDHFGEPTYSSKLTLTVPHPHEELGLCILNGNPQFCPIERGTTNCHPDQHNNS
jgi:hypothetical protein